MAAQKTSAFQQVLEALERARDAGEDALRRDELTRAQDDQDCYPHGVVITLPKTHEAWRAVRFLAKNLNWVVPGARGMFTCR